jgi:hypothetical protein
MLMDFDSPPMTTARSVLNSEIDDGRSSVK